MLEELKNTLIGKIFEEENYYQALKNIVGEFDLEVNTCDFDNERVYQKGYENKENWEDELIAHIDKKFIDVYDENGDIDRQLVEIIDVY